VAMGLVVSMDNSSMENHKNSAGFAPPAPLTPSTVEHWRVLLAEFVHLLGLLLIHSRHAKSVRATSVLFDQMLRHLTVLEKMPGHESTMVMSCTRPEKASQAGQISYRILFGNLILQRAMQGVDVAPFDGKHSAYLNNALDHTFDYLLQQGIQGLYFQLPGGSAEKINQLRLTLNIIARFQDAVTHQGTVTFHYGSRAMAIPLIYDHHNQPDYNLTLLAGINGLTNANTRELLKQARAFHDLALSKNVDDQQTYPVIKDGYNQIFKVRSLRSQIVKPPVEVNNLPWIEGQTGVPKKTEAVFTQKESAINGEGTGVVGNREVKRIGGPYDEQPVRNDFAQTAATRNYLAAYLDGHEDLIRAALDDVIIDDYSSLETQAVAERLVAVSRMLYAIEKKSQDPGVVDRLLYFLQVRMLQVSDLVLANIEVQRQGLKFYSQGRAIVVGLVHSRLVDLIILVKDQVVTRQKIDIIRKIAFDFTHQYAGLVVDGFGVSDKHAHHLLDLFKSCFDAQGSFYRDAFEARIDTMAQQADAFFEINWCFLKETPRHLDRLAFLNAIQLLMARLQDPKRALRFLLDDLCQHTTRIDYADRNAFVLANILMQAENKALHVDLERSPDSLLHNARDIHGEVQRYALWRINTDQIRVVIKVKTIHHALEQAFKDSAQDPAIDKEGTVGFLLALEREALIFLTLVNGPTARRILRGMLKVYGQYQAAIYRRAGDSGQNPQIMEQLQLVVRCMGCVGYAEDIQLLKNLAQSADHFCALDPHPSQALQVKLVLKQVADAIKRLLAQAP
jgi:hypothetical protein